jgi:hypothetical protein
MPQACCPLGLLLLLQVVPMVSHPELPLEELLPGFDGLAELPPPQPRKLPPLGATAPRSSRSGRLGTLLLPVTSSPTERP